ncbi:MAG: cyclic nucleotide-binding domain-containing protein [Bacteriovoracaceae bacterium]|nr:cyclic nucleotide-binding domain-containing protein [Bacteriovoracaceae bacterium]
MSAASTNKTNAKSGLRTLKPGEILFNDGEKANSLYIIQNGQLRLFKPKGKGFIEIAVLRAGEVIGEMAYFDDDGGGKRSCSASAMVSSEVIEISFTAFAKTMSGLNPWFKTIINTLANRLRATNSRVKELESNSATVNYGTGKHSGYEFFKSNDIIKILGTLFLVFKTHGEDHSNGVALHRKTLDLYSKEIYGIIESKLDEMAIILEDLGHLSYDNDKNGHPNVWVLRSLEEIRGLFIFYNTEKYLTDDKKLKIGTKCQTFLEHIWQKLKSQPNTEAAMTEVVVSDLIEAWKEKGLVIGLESLDDARVFGIVGEVIVQDEGSLSLEVNYHKLKKQLPNIQFMNRVLEANKQKSATA